MKNTNLGSQTVVVDSDGLWTPNGRRFRGLRFPVDAVCYTPGHEDFREVGSKEELRALLAQLGTPDADFVIAEALNDAPVRVRIDPELRRAFSGVEQGWLLI